jgi:hypothetical protein
MTEQDYRVRECVHRDGRAAGSFYRGEAYVKHLQRLRGETAVAFAGRVTAFFWADAAHILVWLCRDCAEELGIAE